MFFLLGGEKTEKAKKTAHSSNVDKVRELFKLGRFPVVTTQDISDRKIAKVLGLVCCRGFDADEAFFGMAAMAQNKGGQAIIGYSENIAFHPDGSKFFSCFGTAVMFDRDSRDVRDTHEKALQSNRSSTLSAESQSSIPTASTHVYADAEDDTEELLNLAVAQSASHSQVIQPISEDEDPVLQRLLAQKKQTRKEKLTIQ